MIAAIAAARPRRACGRAPASACASWRRTPWTYDGRLVNHAEVAEPIPKHGSARASSWQAQPGGGGADLPLREAAASSMTRGPPLAAAVRRRGPPDERGPARSRLLRGPCARPVLVPTVRRLRWSRAPRAAGASTRRRRGDLVPGVMTRRLAVRVGLAHDVEAEGVDAEHDARRRRNRLGGGGVFRVRAPIAAVETRDADRPAVTRADNATVKHFARSSRASRARRESGPSSSPARAPRRDLRRPRRRVAPSARGCGRRRCTPTTRSVPRGVPAHASWRARARLLTAAAPNPSPRRARRRRAVAVRAQPAVRDFKRVSRLERRLRAPIRACDRLSRSVGRAVGDPGRAIEVNVELLFDGGGRSAARSRGCAQTRLGSSNRFR